MSSVRAAVMVLLLIACGSNTPAPPPPQPASAPRIVFPDGHVVKLELALDDATRAQGMMYRDHMAEDQGMLFLFSTTGEYPFWMKNTLIPLDMIWIDQDKRVVHIEHNVQPCKADPCPSYPPGAMSRYVLEVAGGVAARHRLANGQVLRFEALDNVVIR